MRPAIAVARINKNGKVTPICKTKYFNARDCHDPHKDNFSIWYQRARILGKKGNILKVRAYATREGGRVTDFTFDLKKKKLIDKNTIGTWSEKYEKELEKK